MSRPGDAGRRQVTATGDVETVTTTVDLIRGIPGARSFELAYDAVDRSLAPGEEPRPDEAIRWTASVVIRRRVNGRRIDHTYTGTHVVPPGGDHARGGTLACVRLLERLGANTVVLDLTEVTDR